MNICVHFPLDASLYFFKLNDVFLNKLRGRVMEKERLQRQEGRQERVGVTEVRGGGTLEDGTVPGFPMLSETKHGGLRVRISEMRNRSIVV